MQGDGRMRSNISAYPWFKFAQSLIFWQATWFLYFESQMSAAEAILLYAVYDIATTALEVPSGYMSDRLGRKVTLIAAGLCGVVATALLVIGGSFANFVLANVFLGASAAFASGTDSALLYESLLAEGRASEAPAAELKAWRFGFVALAVSALSGGVLARFDVIYPYVAASMAACLTVAVTMLFKEPPHAAPVPHRENLRVLRRSLLQPTLLWLLCLSLLMYVFSHIHFVFGQPFIREALESHGLASETPVISGGVTFTMMMLSVATSAVALPLRNRFGLGPLLLLAFAIQVGLAAALAMSNGVFVITLLFLRMVPDSLSTPFIRARSQQLLTDGVRATYFSVQSLAGRVLFAITLGFAATSTTDGAPLPYADLQVILVTYAAFGLVLLIGLGSTYRRVRL